MIINRKKQNHISISTTFIKAKLSLEAKGLLLFIMSIPKVKNFYDDVLRFNKTTKTDIDNILKELETNGYYDSNTNTFYETPISYNKTKAENAIDKSLISHTTKPLIALKTSYDAYINDIKDFQCKWNIIAEKRKLPKLVSIETTNRKAGWKKVFDLYPYSDKGFWDSFFNNLDSEEITEYAKQVYGNKKFFSSDFFIRDNKYERVEELSNGTLVNKKEAEGIGSTFTDDKNTILNNIKVKQI